jgi:hypothetical protein
MNMLVRVLIKAGVLFLLFNAFCVVFDPFPVSFIREFNLYNTLVPGRERLPYAEIPSESYSVSLLNLDDAFAVHEIAGGEPDNDSLVLIGDSSVWGWLLQPDETLGACLEKHRDVTAYNLGYPLLNVTKDLLILDQALAYQPDYIIWLVTLASFYPQEQLDRELIHANASQLQALIERYDLSLDLEVSETAWIDKTLFGKRRTLADWLRIQGYAPAWVSTGVDHRNPKFFDPVPMNLPEMDALVDGTSPQEWMRNDLAFDVLQAGMARAAEEGVPVLLVNEPIYRSSGTGSDLRYTFLYPRWAYDRYRELLAELAIENGWNYLDLWDMLPPEAFTDSEFHLTLDATCQLAERLGEALP